MPAASPSPRATRVLLVCFLALVGLLGAGVAVETTRADSSAGPTGTTGAPVTPSSVVDDEAVPPVDARAYVVFDERSMRSLASLNAGDRRSVGSLMKLLNAYVAYGAGDPDRVVVAPEGLGGASDESVIGIRAGQTVTRRVLIRAMLKVSANDAARLLALDIAGSEARYAELMTDAAAHLGLADTHAANATGLDADGQFSSANDLLALARELLDEPVFRQTVSEPTAKLNGHTFANTNDLLGAYVGADGVKTGHTSDAGWCILASATRDGRRVMVVVLGASTERSRDEVATTLLDWAFTH